MSECWVGGDSFSFPVIPPPGEVFGCSVVGLDCGWFVFVKGKGLDLLKGSGVKYGVLL